VASVCGGYHCLDTFLPPKKTRGRQRPEGFRTFLKLQRHSFYVGIIVGDRCFCRCKLPLGVWSWTIFLRILLPSGLSKCYPSSVPTSQNIPSSLVTHIIIYILLTASYTCTQLLIMTAQIRRPTLSSKNKTNSQDVRNKFFRRIGVAGTDPNDFSKYKRESADGTTDPCIPTRDLQNVPRYSTQLKYNRNDERIRMKRLQQRSAATRADKNSSLSSSESPPKTKKSKPKRCTFNESVKVVPIPKRNEYSDRIRSRLWSGTIELYENAGRSWNAMLLTLHTLALYSVHLTTILVASCVHLSSESCWICCRKLWMAQCLWWWRDVSETLQNVLRNNI